MAGTCRRKIIDRAYSSVKCICWFIYILSLYNQVHGDMQAEIRILYFMFTADNSRHTGTIFCGMKQPGCEANHLLHSIAEVKNDRSCTSIPPVYLHGIYGDDYTFLSVSIYDD